MVIDNNQKSALVIDILISNDRNVVKKEYNKVREISSAERGIREYIEKKSESYSSDNWNTWNCNL